MATRRKLTFTIHDGPTRGQNLAVESYTLEPKRYKFGTLRKSYINTGCTHELFNQVLKA